MLEYAGFGGGLTSHQASQVILLVERCREEGYATNVEELEICVQSMAVPVCDRNGLLVAAMSIAVRVERMGASEFRDRLLPLLRKARDALQTKLFPTAPGA